MSIPRLVFQILVAGTQIFGKAFIAAARQAAKNAKSAPEALNDVSGVGKATSGSMTDSLTRSHRMTLEEAHLILNTKQSEGTETVFKKYEHLFKANSPAPPPAEPPAGGRRVVVPAHSHYLQSKVVRAWERIEAEQKIAAEEARLSRQDMPSGPPPPKNGDTNASTP